MIELQKSTLEAALLTAAVNDIRYYLNGVAINRGALVSTNGDALFLAEIDAPDDVEIIIPRDTIKVVLAKIRIYGAKIWLNNPLIVEHFMGDEWRIYCREFSELFTPINGTFPDWKKAIKPKKKIPNPSLFNHKYIKNAVKTAKLLKSQGMRFTQYSAEASIVEFSDELNCKLYIMPLRE